MKKILELGNRYAAQSSWADFALTKFCLCSMGILLGLRIPKRHGRMAEILAGGVFLGTYIPLMAKILCVAKAMMEEASANTIEEEE